MTEDEFAKFVSFALAFESFRVGEIQSRAGLTLDVAVRAAQRAVGEEIVSVENFDDLTNNPQNVQIRLENGGRARSVLDGFPTLSGPRSPLAVAASDLDEVVAALGVADLAFEAAVSVKTPGARLAAMRLAQGRLEQVLAEFGAVISKELKFEVFTRLAVMRSETAPVPGATSVRAEPAVWSPRYLPAEANGTASWSVRLINARASLQSFGDISALYDGGRNFPDYQPVARTPVEWLVVVHPDTEVAERRAMSVRDAFPDARVWWSTRATDVTRLDTSLPSDPGAVLLHLDGVDRYANAWGGHRVARRLADRGICAVAWVSSQDVAGYTFANQLGVRAVIRPQKASGALDLGAVDLRGVVSAAIEGRWEPSPTHPGSTTDHALEVWFDLRYGARWHPWMEQASAVTASGAEQSEQAGWLNQQFPAVSPDAWRRRLRHLSEVLSGEIRANQVLLRRESLAVLREIARARPINAEPLTARSIRFVFRRLEADRQLAVEAGLTPKQVDDLTLVAHAERDISGGAVRRRGRPDPAAWRAVRSMALGRVAQNRGTTSLERLVELERLTAALEETLDALYDALSDRERSSGT